MTYRERIEQSIQGVYEKGIATKILQHMGRIRNAFDITQARRWIMELMQNARDLAYPGQSVKIRVKLEKDKLTFEHTGKPFRVKDILAIINQVSSKDPGEGVGQFGTGFITTYQLSEQVEIFSVLKEENLPYRKFHVTLDRRGKTQEELHKAIEKNMKELCQADEEGIMEEFDNSGFHTAFVYHLDNQRSFGIALTGMRDLKDTIRYIMLFSEKIGSVELVFEEGTLQEEACRILYERGTKRMTQTPPLMETEIRMAGESHILRYMTENQVTLAMEYDPEKGYLPIGINTARLFIDFPLTGAEDFPFPVVVNSLRFHPNEPRSGIALVDLENSEDSRNNKAVMDDAVRLYEKFLKLAVQSRMSGIENLLCMPGYHTNPEWSEVWVRERLYDRIYGVISGEAIFDTPDGSCGLNNEKLKLLCAGDKDERRELAELCRNMEGILVPSGEVNWYASLSSYRQISEKKLTLEMLLLQAKELVGENRVCAGDSDKTLLWCQKLYELGMRNKETEVLIRTGKAAIFPNQSFKEEKHILYSAAELYRDPDIPEVLKDVAETLDELRAQDTLSNQAEPLNIRQKLLNRNFRAENLEQMTDFPISGLTDYIAVRSRREFKVVQFSYYADTYRKAWKKAWMLMLSCGQDQNLYELCNKIWNGEIPEYKPLRDMRFSQGLWKSSCLGLINLLLEKLETAGNRKSLASGMDAEWMTELFQIALKYGDVFSMGSRKIFPNQKGDFLSLNQLSVDQIKYQDLKDISEHFKELDAGCDIRQELLDQTIRLDAGWNFRSIRDSEAAYRISGVIQRILSEGNLNDSTENVQEACTMLLAWLQEHPDKVSEYFPGFSTEEQQARLVTSKAVVHLQKRSRTYEKLLELTGTDNPEELLKMINLWKESGKDNISVTEKEDRDSVSYGYDETTGVFYGSEFESMEDAERQEVFRMIGNAGEQYVLEKLLDAFSVKGWRIVLEQSGRYLLEKGDKTEDSGMGNSGMGINVFSGIMDDYSFAEIVKPDHGNYHQEGWDIRIRFWDEKMNSTEKICIEKTPDREIFLEVKTHTTKSVMRGMLPLSNSQMRFALKEGDNYMICMTEYSWSIREVIDICAYANLAGQICEGRIWNTEGRYLLKVG